MFKRVRSLLSHSRVPLGVGAVDNANVYRVRFLKPPRPRGGGGRLLHIFGGLAVTIILGLRVVQVMSASGQPVFIPLSFPKQEEQQKYKRSDPEVKAFMRFGSDRARTRRVRRAFEEKTIEILRKSFPDQFLGQVKPTHSLLYFHYPPGPPRGYLQKGLQLSYKPPDLTATDPEDKYSVLTVEYVERRLKQEQYLQREAILFPRWMFNAVNNSIRTIWADITLPRDSNEDDKIEDINDLVQYGVDLSQWTLQSFKDDLKKTKRRMPPPNGHIIIDGMVQVTTDNILITVDITGSFNPQKPDEATMHRIAVRFASKIKQPPQKFRMVDAPKPMDLSKAVVSGLKKDIEMAKAAAKKGEPELETSKALVEKCVDAEKRDAESVDDQDIVKRLVPTNVRVEKLDTKKSEEDQHKPRQDAPPATPSEPQQSPPPRE
ncbi:hypothetical protein BZA05DRAFT_406056 [Tricharina praecox]|uniref:uncharacterized protein n=1 Tax=Tricharina praecox TaxID=43433 RepID=UPI00222088CE|nr:uncharacterized protein BZA05DRAFT_406056 [Tricharina praecox]KAI5846984.1 hypothetical protein BZA05DRAFT_406056 [Tricharina praecox]